MVETLEDDGCLKRVEECKMESGQATVVRTLTKMCCNKEKAVQWFHFKEAATGNLLDFEAGRIKISARNVSRSEQMWRIEDGRLLNKHEPNTVLGLREGMLTMVKTEDSGAMNISFEEGVLLEVGILTLTRNLLILNPNSVYSLVVVVFQSPFAMLLDVRAMFSILDMSIYE